MKNIAATATGNVAGVELAAQGPRAVDVAVYALENGILVEIGTFVAEVWRPLELD